MTGFADVLDWISIMNYDIWGPWNSRVGPNAPLADACAATAYQLGSATSAVKAWSGAGFPEDKIVLGVPGYGHSFRVPRNEAYEEGSTTLASYPRFESHSQPTGDAWDQYGGTYNLWGLVDMGYLSPNGSVKSGIGYRYDACSDTVSRKVCHKITNKRAEYT